MVVVVGFVFVLLWWCWLVLSLCCCGGVCWFCPLVVFVALFVSVCLQVCIKVCELVGVCVCFTHVIVGQVDFNKYKQN